MEINTINGHTRTLGAPSNWDHSKGECVGLPIMDQDTENGPCMISEWQPEADDIKLLNMGMPIHLWVYCNTHPVVSISVGQPTQEAIDSDSISAHADDIAIDNFANAMKAKMAASRAKGRSGWDDPNQCTVEYLAKLFGTNLFKGNAGNYVDLANFCMMLHLREANPRAIHTYAMNSWKAMLERQGVEPCHLLQTIKDLVACDAYAIAFQTMAQYRTALMKEIEKALADNTHIDHDIALMPRSLTAENGAKAALIGEFFVPVQVACNQCDNEGILSDGTECADCEGTGTVIDHEIIDWTTIKAIYKKAVEVCEVKSVA